MSEPHIIHKHAVGEPCNDGCFDYEAAVARIKRWNRRDLYAQDLPDPDPPGT